MKLSIVMGLYSAIFLFGYFTNGIEPTLVVMAGGTATGAAFAMIGDGISELKKIDEEAEKNENS